MAQLRRPKLTARRWLSGLAKVTMVGKRMFRTEGERNRTEGQSKG